MAQKLSEKVIVDLANTPEAIQKREERKKKREAKQKKDPSSSKPLHRLSPSEKERESVKEIIENITKQMRVERKRYLLDRTSQWQDERKLTVKDVIFLTSPILYDRYPIQMAEFLTEAIKYPDDDIRKVCSEFFTRMQRARLNQFLWKMIFSADFVPKVAQDYFHQNEALFQKDPLVWALAQKAKESKFAGNEDRFSPEIINREEIKARIETLYHLLRKQRKAYFKDFKTKELKLSAEMLQEIIGFCDMKYYKEFPIQIANLIYEGSKYPITEVSIAALELWQTSLKQGMSDVFLWAKMMLSDLVIDEVWGFLFTYADVLTNQKKDLYFYIRLKETADVLTNQKKDLYFYIRLKETQGRNRSLDLDTLYADVCRLYR